jgi:hypothetical protein
VPWGILSAVRTGAALGIILVAFCVAGCDGCGRKADSQGTPLADGMRIPIERDDKTLVVVDRVLLDRTPADFSDDERKAWRLSTLIAPRAIDARTTIEVEDAKGARIVVVQPSDTLEGRQAILTVNRQGELRMAVTRPDEDVFASFHGRGGNRGRGGDPGRVREVRHVWLREVDGG